MRSVARWRAGWARAALVLGLAALIGATPRAAESPPRGGDELDMMFAELRQARTEAQMAAIEARIQEHWGHSGSPSVDSLLGTGIVRMARGDYDHALDVLDRVVVLAPSFAEGWNTRATVEFLRGDDAASLRDIERVLALEPRHFGALTGRAMIHLAHGHDKEALRALEQVLALEPSAPGVRTQVEALRVRLGYRQV